MYIDSGDIVMPPNKIRGITKSNCPSVRSFIRSFVHSFVRPFKLCPHLGAFITFYDPILVFNPFENIIETGTFAP